MGTIRIFLAGLGGVAGIVAWCVGMTTAHLWPLFLQALYGNRPEDTKKLVFWVGSMLLCGFGAGALVLFAGERLHLFPSPEEIDRKSRPVSLFANEERDRRAQ